MMIISQEKKDTAPQDPRQSGCFENFEGNLKPQQGPKTDFQSKVNAHKAKLNEVHNRSLPTKHKKKGHNEPSGYD